MKTPEENSFTEILLYNTPNGGVKVEIYLQNETVWLTEQKIAELFDVDRTVITKHLKNIFETNELDPNSVSAKIAHTAADGKKYPTQFYNLDAISCRLNMEQFNNGYHSGQLANPKNKHPFNDLRLSVPYFSR